MRLLICGDRNWTSRWTIETMLRQCKADIVIEGEARGADTLAREVAEQLEIDVLPFPADWKKHKRAAGPIRNQQMLDEGKPDAVWAFHNDIDNSKGTKDMVRRAHKAGLPVTIVSVIQDSIICNYIAPKKGGFL